VYLSYRENGLTAKFHPPAAVVLQSRFSVTQRDYRY
jgi:hypothetical protein